MTICAVCRCWFGWVGQRARGALGVADRLRDALPHPGWRDLPRLAWTAARAWGPPWQDGPAGWLARVWAGPAALTFWYHYLLMAHLDGDLVAVDRSALAVVGVVGRHRWKAYGATVLAFTVCMFLASAVMIVVEIVFVLVGWTSAATVVAGATYGVPAISLVTLLSLVARSWTIPRARPGWLRAHRGDIHISCIAAWPRERGHGGRLMDTMVVALTGEDRRVVAVALTPALAEVYRRRARRYPDAVFLLANDEAAIARARASS